MLRSLMFFFMERSQTITLSKVELRMGTLSSCTVSSMKTVTHIFQVWTNSMQLHESQRTEIKLKPRQMRHSLLTTKLPDKK